MPPECVASGPSGEIFPQGIKIHVAVAGDLISDVLQDRVRAEPGRQDEADL